MFGYVVPSRETLSKEEERLYRTHYCGLCHSIERRYGHLERFALSYDLTFLSLLLTSLYEPDQAVLSGRCLPHPLRSHPYLQGEIQDYCADMNLLLFYYKVQDDLGDEGGLFHRMEDRVLNKAFRQIRERYPKQASLTRETMEQFHQAESRKEPSLDELLNLSAHLLGDLYAFREDYWTRAVCRIGEGLGRFIYLMDAWDDLPEDQRKKRFNPLLGMTGDADLPSFVQNSLVALLGEAAEAFEFLPLVYGAGVLRNILYSGCWTRFNLLQKQRGNSLVKKGVHQ